MQHLLEKVLFYHNWMAKASGQWRGSNKCILKNHPKGNILKQAAVTKRVDIFNLRHSSHAGTQTDRINNMLNKSGAGDNDVNARPTAEAGMGDNGVNPRETSDTGFGDFQCK